jgi:hypothetical protein
VKTVGKFLKAASGAVKKQDKRFFKVNFHRPVEI